jgi:hypothetical protein
VSPATAAIGDVGLRMVDPVDWFYTAVDCMSDACSSVDVLFAILPLLPGGLSKIGKFSTIQDADNAIKGVGQVVRHSPAMPEVARLYQATITGIQPGWEILRNGVRFDGVRFNDIGQAILLDAKYANGIDSFYFKTNLSFVQDKMLTEAYDQLRAADGLAIEWHVSDNTTAKAIRALFNEYDINISVIYTPVSP